jgi:hypothetical protein
MFLKCDPYRVWCSIFYSKLVNCILLRSLFVFVKGRGTCRSGERNVKIWIDFRKSPRFSPTSPLSQEREKSSRPVFTMCGEPWIYRGMGDLRKPHYGSCASDPIHIPSNVNKELWDYEKGHNCIYHIIIFSWHRVTCMCVTCNRVSSYLIAATCQ